MSISLDLGAFLIGIISIVATIVGSYISLRVKVAEIGVKVDRSEIDINNLGDLIRKIKQREPIGSGE